ncbi:hypothetical protein FS749_006141 [Ceratobasidium sp. UAMH 11750]|nr:hypothetical protein FS749_006141 [Ceratobasidium sp. UAMH 11750]
MLHQHTADLIHLFAQQPLIASRTAMSASPSHFVNAPHHYPPLPGKPLTGLPYIRKHFYAPEVSLLLRPFLHLADDLTLGPPSRRCTELCHRNGLLLWVRSCTKKRRSMAAS